MQIRVHLYKQDLRGVILCFVFVNFGYQYVKWNRKEMNLK